MTALRLIARWSWKAGPTDYLLAAGLSVAAVIGRAAINAAVPGVAYFILLFPALVFTGAFLGTGPAVTAALTGAVAAAMAFLGPPLLAWPPFNAEQIDALLFLPACASVIWATHVLRRSAAAALAAEARLTEVFRQIPGAAAILEAPSGRLLMRSAQSNNVLGHEQHKMDKAGDIAEYGGIHPDGTPYRPQDYPIVRALTLGAVVPGEMLTYRRPGGCQVDLEVHAGPVRGQDGRIVAAVGMAFDVSDRVAAQRRLQESETLHREGEERLRAAIDAGALGLWELDLVSGQYQIDAAFAKMLGLPAKPARIPRADLQSFIHPDHAAGTTAAVDRAIARADRYADEVRMRTPQGEDRWLVTRGTVLHETQTMVGVVNDVTERRQRENALADALRTRDVLMHEADHRIKNSLQLVVSLLGLQMRRTADPDAKSALGAAAARVEAIANAHYALETSPDLKSIETGRMLKHLCEQMATLNPAVTVTCDIRAGAVLDADRAIPLGLIASELLTNALMHAYPAGGRGSVRLAASVRDGMLEVTVADGGTGMPAVPSRQGLGTTLIAAMARQIGAAMDTGATPGGGCSVALRLPLRRDGAAPPLA